MARFQAGGTAADYTIVAGDTVTISTPSGDKTGQNAVVLGGIEVTWWNDEVGGTQYTDLLDSAGTPVVSLLSSDGTDGRALGQIGRVWYQDGVTGAWASAGGGPRVWMPADLGAQVVATAAQAQDTADDFAAYAAAPPIAQSPSWSQDTATVGPVGGAGYRRYNLTGRTMTLRAVLASVGGNTPSGASIIVTLRVNGVEVFTSANRPAIAAGSRDSGVVTALATTAWPAGGYLTVEVIQVGSTTPGSKLVVEALAY